MKQAPFVVVIYDSIHNSVFDSQVVNPLIQMLQKQPKRKAIIISFEKQRPSKKTIQDTIAHHSSLSLIICKKLPYVGLISLYYAARSLKKVLHQYSEYDIQARGPLAGFICQKALSKSSCKSFMIQARGLLAAEYAYEHASEKSLLNRLWHRFREWQFFNLEKKVYTKSTAHKQPGTIQAVSRALAEYLITAYDADRSSITIAAHDIPARIAPAQVESWKHETKKELTIAPDATVYCYNGSIKPWQCPEQVIEYFKQKHQENAQVFLLILTQDIKKFEKRIMHHAIAHHAYRVLTVAHKDIYRYLSCADIGLIFRQSHIVNWVSRPTKALEYTAVGLHVEHNNTVAWLVEQEKNSSFVAQDAQEVTIDQKMSITQAALDSN
jgi:hypothetical protein